MVYNQEKKRSIDDHLQIYQQIKTFGFQKSIISDNAQGLTLKRGDPTFN